MRTGIRRRTYLVNKPLQFSYAGVALWFLLIGMIAIGAVSYYVTLNTVLAELEKQGANASLQADELVRNINLLLIKRMGLLTLALMAFAFFLSAYYLHRIAGPIFHIQRTLDEMAEGKRVEPVRLRRKDMFKPLAETVNRLIARRQKDENRQ